MEALSDIDLIEICQSDKRHTLILDLEDNNIVEGVRPVFCNAALEASSKLLINILGIENSDNHQHAGFIDWMKSAFSDASYFTYQGLLWTSNTLRERWRIISGVVLPTTLDIVSNGGQRSMSSPSSSLPAFTHTISGPTSIENTYVPS